jgi:hypothetical protein
MITASGGQLHWFDALPPFFFPRLKGLLARVMLISSNAIFVWATERRAAEHRSAQTRESTPRVVFPPHSRLALTTECFTDSFLFSSGCVLLCFTKRSPCLGMVVHEFIHYSHKENG